ncbi:MAG TPA: ATP-binding protein [Pyrinomonadaceae bacterium]|jgi:anti-sigma regulatory factor (Ser/Thr protein kinase)
MREINSIEIKDAAQVGAARRVVHGFAGRLGFDENQLAEIDIVVQEIGTNAVSYAATGGWLHFTTTPGDAPGIELFYWDTGPGIYNLDRAIRDGVSTSGGLGAGLGAIKRLMDEFDVYSTVRTTARLSLSAQRRTTHGTALLARKWLASNTEADGEETPGRLQSKRLGLWSRPRPSETVNGDAYFIRTRDRATLYAVVDGLGHGHGAKEASDVALSVLDDWRGEPLDRVFHAAHDALRATRGAVMSAVVIDDRAHSFQFAGVGNVMVRVFEAPERITPIATNGTLGARLGQVRVWTHAWAEGATCVLASDGVSAAWEMDAYPGLLSRSPQLLAGILMRDYGRESDDATVMVIR